MRTLNSINDISSDASNTVVFAVPLEVLKAIELIAAKATKAGVVPGIHVGSVAYAKRCRDMGYRLITYLSDFRLLQQATARSIAAVRAFEPAPGVA